MLSGEELAEILDSVIDGMVHAIVMSYEEPERAADWQGIERIRLHTAWHILRQIESDEEYERRFTAEWWEQS